MSLIPIVRKVSGCNRHPASLVFEVIAHTTVDDRFQEAFLRMRWLFRNSKERYAMTWIGRRGLYLHQLVWITAGNALPIHPLSLDHIDRNSLNNQLDNLRIADPSTQAKNKGLQKNNTSGFKGVSQKNGKWRAVIHAEGKQRFLGYFTTKEEAYAAFKAAHDYYFPGVSVVE